MPQFLLKGDFAFEHAFYAIAAISTARTSATSALDSAGSSDAAPQWVERYRAFLVGIGISAPLLRLSTLLVSG